MRPLDSLPAAAPRSSSLLPKHMDMHILESCSLRSAMLAYDFARLHCKS